MVLFLFILGNRAVIVSSLKTLYTGRRQNSINLLLMAIFITCYCFRKANVILVSLKTLYTGGDILIIIIGYWFVYQNYLSKVMSVIKNHRMSNTTNNSTRNIRK